MHATKFTTILVAVLFFLFLPSALFADGLLTDGMHMCNNLKINVAGDDHLDFGTEKIARSHAYRGRLWTGSKVFGLTWIRHDDDFDFSCQGFVNLTTMVGYLYFTGQDFEESRLDPLFLLLTFPSSEYNYALSEDFSVGFSNNTDYIFFRGTRGRKGIYYTPNLQVTYWVEKSEFEPIIAGLQLQAGYINFIDFEGHNSSSYWSVGFTLFWGFFRRDDLI